MPGLRLGHMLVLLACSVEALPVGSTDTNSPLKLVVAFNLTLLSHGKYHHTKKEDFNLCQG